MRHKHADKLGKILLRLFPRPILQALGHDPGPQPLHWEDVTVNLPELTADRVLMVGAPDDPRRFAICFELEFRPKTRNLAAWCLKRAALAKQLGCRVFLVVIYLRRGNYAAFPTSLLEQEGSLRNGFEFTAVRLWEWVPLIRGGPLRGLAPVLFVCEDNLDEARLDEVQQLIYDGDFTGQEREDLLALTATIATFYMGKTVVMKKMSFEERWLRRSPLLREQRAEGREEGRQEGRQEGQQEGAVTELRRTVQRMAEKRFGPLPGNVVAAIAAADLELCRVVLDRMLEDTALADLGLGTPT